MGDRQAPHWTVYVTKVGKKSVLESTVGWAVRQIYLDTNDFAEREECFGPPKDLCVAQVPVVHEFGHTLGNIGGIHGGGRAMNTMSEACSPATSPAS